MKSALRTTFVLISAIFAMAITETAIADDDRPDLPRYVGTYLVDIEITTIGQFDCQFLLDLGFLQTCTGAIVLTLHADGTMESNDSSDFNDGFDGLAQGNWRRSGFGSSVVSAKTLSLGYDVDGTLENYIVRELALDFNRNRTSFTGHAASSVFNSGLDPLDPAVVPDVVIKSTVNGRKFR